MASPWTSSICWLVPPPAPRSHAPSKMAFKLDDADGSRRVGTSLAEINIIPLVDVVLVLLLIFMLTAPMMYRGIDVNLPRAASRPTAVEERLVLTVTKEQGLFLNDKRLTAGGLDQALCRESGPGGRRGRRAAPDARSTAEDDGAGDDAEGAAVRARAATGPGHAGPRHAVAHCRAARAHAAAPNTSAPASG